MSLPSSPPALPSAAANSAASPSSLHANPSDAAPAARLSLPELESASVAAPLPELQGGGGGWSQGSSGRGGRAVPPLLLRLLVVALVLLAAAVAALAAIAATHGLARDGQAQQQQQQATASVSVPAATADSAAPSPTLDGGPAASAVAAAASSSAAFSSSSSSSSSASVAKSELSSSPSSSSFSSSRAPKSHHPATRSHTSRFHTSHSASRQHHHSSSSSSSPASASHSSSTAAAASSSSTSSSVSSRNSVSSSGSSNNRSSSSSSGSSNSSIRHNSSGSGSSNSSSSSSSSSTSGSSSSSNNSGSSGSSSSSSSSGGSSGQAASSSSASSFASSSSLSVSPPLTGSDTVLVFEAASFGAVANDLLDDTAALQSAIDAAVAASTASVVQLSSGVYRLSASLLFWEAQQVTLQGVSSAATQLLVTSTAAAIQYYYVHGLTLRGLSIDYDPLPFTAGLIQYVNSSFPHAIDVAVVAPHTVQVGMPASAVYHYDLANQRPASAPFVLDTYPEATLLSTQPAAGVVRFPLMYDLGFQAGDAVVVRFFIGDHAVTGTANNSDVLLQDVVVYASYDMGHAASEINGLTVSDYHVRRQSGRWQSTNADCQHFGECSGSMVIVNSSCDGMGDDGVNVHGTYFNVTTVFNSSAVVLTGLDDDYGLLNVEPGTPFAFAHASTIFTPYGYTVVARTFSYSGTSNFYSFTTPITGVRVGDVVYQSNTPSLFISNFTVSNNRGRGVVVETANVTIENCLFRTSAPGVLISPELGYWVQSMNAYNVTIRNNVFDQCNQGMAAQEGVVAITPIPIQLTGGVVKNISIVNNTFIQGPYSGAVLEVDNGLGVLLAGNFIDSSRQSSTLLLPAVTICKSQAVTVRNNSFLTLNSSWTWDLSWQGCSNTGSTGLAFSADAFSACFAPPVMASPSGYGVAAVTGSLHCGAGFSTAALSQLQFFHQGVVNVSDRFVYTQSPYGQTAFANQTSAAVEASWMLGADILSNLNPAGSIPIGMSSAVPLGGLGTGSYEIRADGSMRLSTIRNQDMAGEPWQGTVRDFTLVFSINGQPHVLNANQQLPGLIPAVPTLVYQGLYPLAHFAFLNLSLYMYSAVTPCDLQTSNMPAVAYTLHVHNSSPTVPMNVSFLLIMPFGLRNDWNQLSSSALQVNATVLSAGACAAYCAQSALCSAWQFQQSSSACWLDSAVYAEGFSRAGSDSGNPGSWSLGERSVSFLHSSVFTAPQLYNGLGQQSLYSPDAQQPTVGYGDSVQQLMTSILSSNLSQYRAGHLFAAMMTSVSVAPLSNAESSIIHAWYFPTHFWGRNQGGQDHGNYYSNQLTSSLHAAMALNLTALAANLVTWQSAFTGLPPLLQDALPNSFSHARSAAYFKNGDWRQWESYGFSDADSVHNDAERRGDYFVYFPQTEEQKIQVWAALLQTADGLIAEQFGAAFGTVSPYDVQDGREMADVTTMLIILVEEQRTHYNNTALVQQLYASTLLPALQWIISNMQTNPWLLPYQLPTTYDSTQDGQQGTGMYSALFARTALLAMVNLASFMQDAATVATARSWLNTTANSIQSNLWQPAQAFYTGTTVQSNHLEVDLYGQLNVNSDELHCQVEAYRLQLGDLLPLSQMQQHQVFINQTLNARMGLAFNRGTVYGSNWQMGDSTFTTLMLWWNQADPWAQLLLQLSNLRDVQKDFWRPAAATDAVNGQTVVLGYYGWHKWFFHSLPAFAGQTVDLSQQWIAFRPHSQAFNASGRAMVPITLGGMLGTLTVNNAAMLAVVSIKFQSAAYTFRNVSICANRFLGAFTFTVGAPLMFSLSTACPTTASTSMVAYSAATTLSSCWITATSTSNINVSISALDAFVLNETSCIATALQSHVPAVLWLQKFSNYGQCQAGLPCCLLFNAVPQPLQFTTPLVGYGKVNSSLIWCGPHFPSSSACTAAGAARSNVTFGDTAWSPLASSVYTRLLTSSSACSSAALQTQVCGWTYYSSWHQSGLGSCAPSRPCCVLNPNWNCAAAAPLPTATAAGPALLGFLNCPGR